MEIIGHRGSAGTAPENTLAGIKTALDAGAPWLEIDVRLAGDELFVIHDEDVARTTNGAGSIYALSRSAIHNLDAGGGQAVPTLGQVIDTIAATANLNIELKDTLSLQPTLALVAKTLSEDPAWRDRIMLSTFERSIHTALSENLPDGCLLGILLKKIPADAIGYAVGLGAYSLNLAFKQLTPDLLSRAHAAGLKVFVYTVNKESQIERCLRLGVDAIYTDFPARALRLLEDEKYR